MFHRMENTCFSASKWVRKPTAENWDGPVPALWSFDLHSQHAVRITPKRLFGWDGVWIDNANVLFLSQAVGEKSASIYRMSINGKNLKRLIKDARFPTISAP